MDKKAFSFDFSMKSTDDNDSQHEINGIPVKSFVGYASDFTTIDRVNEQVVKGAFKKHLENKGNRTILMHNHKTNIGVADVQEDDSGLLVKGYINMDTQAGKETYSLLKMGAIQKMSFGYSVKDYEQSKTSDGDSFTKLTELELHEVSPVDFPANPATSIVEVKGAQENASPAWGSTIQHLKSVTNDLADYLAYWR
tara:strand:- start:346 stop:933 length:588 start_codon:yes stop_codon:yes gene_type:complete